MIPTSKQHLYQRCKKTAILGWRPNTPQVAVRPWTKTGMTREAFKGVNHYTTVNLCPKIDGSIWFLSLKLPKCFINPLLRVRRRYNKQKRRRSSHVAAVMRSRTPSNWYLRLQPLSFAAYEKNGSKQCAIFYSNAMYRRNYKTKNIVC